MDAIGRKVCGYARSAGSPINPFDRDDIDLFREPQGRHGVQDEINAVPYSVTFDPTTGYNSISGRQLLNTRERIRRYRTVGGGADLVRVEVLVPAEARQHMLDEAARLRSARRGERTLTPDEARVFDEATERYGARCLWNCKPSRTVAGLLTVAEQLKAHGDMRAWRLAMDIEESITNAAR